MKEKTQSRSRPQPQSQQWPKKEYLVGVNYFAGWWRLQPNKWVVRGRDWRRDYPERIPLLGCYNDQETMDAEIIAASEHGVDVFLMLWYVQEPERHAHGERLNTCIEQFKVSPENHRMRFMVEFCNHPPFDIESDQLWEKSCKEWIKSMKHPSYFRLGGKPVFKVHGLEHFYNQNDRNSQKVTIRINRLREMADEAGVGPLLIGAGTMTAGVPQLDNSGLLDSFDYFATYMDVPNLEQKEEPYPYEILLKMAEDGWKQYANSSPLPYMPYIPGGWNPGPWNDPRPRFKFPDEQSWEEALLKVKKALDTYANLRLPDGTGADTGQKMFNIYAWNEFGEGGIVAPTVGDGWMKLKGLCNVFGL